MQRTLTLTGLIALFVAGIAAMAGGIAFGSQTYRIPNDPVATAVLLGLTTGIVIFTVGGGILLALGLGFLSKEVSTPLSPEDRPELEKRMVSAIDRTGSTLGRALSRVGYGEDEPPAPYVPPYSYKATPENVEARTLTLGLALVTLLLLGYAGYSQWRSWTQGLQTLAAPLEPVPGMEVPIWVVGAGLTAVLIGATAATAVGLAIWFYRTHEEKVKADTVKEPAWPSKEIVTWEQRVRGLPNMVKGMTFMDQLLIGLNVMLALCLLGGIAAWVVPNVIAVVAVDQAFVTTPTAVAQEATAGPVGGPGENILAEFEALPAGDPAAGRVVFTSAVPPCATCHNVDSPAVIIGPSQQGVGTRAGTRRPGYSAELYLYESIVEPNAHIVEGFAPGMMPANFKEVLAPQQIADVIAYLMTLK